MNNNLNKVKYEEPCDGRLSSTVPREGRGETPRHLLNLKQLFFRTALLAAVLLPGCGKPEPEESRNLDAETRAQRKYVNLFAWNVMDTYYLWREEVDPAMQAWENWEEPVSKVAQVRYKDRRGEDIDRWTELTDDLASLEGSVSGHTRTLGMDFQLYYADKAHTRVCAVVTYTYAGSPAAAAGLGRGEVILSVDGREMTPDNYVDLVRDGLLGGGTVSMGLGDGRMVRATAVDMYEDPVQTACVLERPGGRKVGYLHYTGFTLESIDPLVGVFRDFVDEGVDDVVLDLRYNGGGYVTAENVLASMLVPLREVEAESVFMQQVYNATLTKELSGQPSRFTEGLLYHVDGELKIASMKGANPDLSRLWVLTSGGSASASEALICGLRPYMDVVVVGGQTHGKYTAGVLMSATEWFGDVKDALDEGEYGKALPYVDNWGIYVMFARYADCNGVTLSMPDGIAPDFEVGDDPLDGHALGDPEETLLAAALSLMEGRTRAAAAGSPSGLEPLPRDFHPRTTGLLVTEPIR